MPQISLALLNSLLWIAHHYLIEMCIKNLFSKKKKIIFQAFQSTIFKHLLCKIVVNLIYSECKLPGIYCSLNIWGLGESEYLGPTLCITFMIS